LAHPLKTCSSVATVIQVCQDDRALQ